MGGSHLQPTRSGGWGLRCLLSAQGQAEGRRKAATTSTAVPLCINQQANLEKASSQVYRHSSRHTVHHMSTQTTLCKHQTANMHARQGFSSPKAGGAVMC